MQRLISIIFVMLLSTTAYAAAPSENGDPGNAFLRSLDANNDGSVSEDEFIKPQVQHLKGQFAYMDKNRDNQIDIKEARDFAEEMRQKFLEKRNQRQQQNQN